MEGHSKDNRVVPLKSTPVGDILQEILREGARRMLQTAIEAEVQAYCEQHRQIVDEQGHRLVVRNGYHPERLIQTGLGDVPVQRPRVNDKRVDENGERMSFTSSVLPPYLRRSKSIEELIPWLYLKGVSSGDFSEALAALLGQDARGLSASTVVRLKEHWLDEYKTWGKRSLKGKRYVYFWADGIYPRIRLGESDGQCFLVIMGATVDGTKELVALGEGMRESEIAWTEVLLDLKKRGLEIGPELAVGDGALGFWAAIGKAYPQARHQRCWVHKTCNVLDKLPKNQQAKAKGLLHEIWQAETRKAAGKAFDHFIAVYSDKYQRAVQCLAKDRDELLAFYDFPAQHWRHLRTTNPIESAFATIRLRTKRTKGHGSAQAALSMAFKLAKCAEKHWMRLHGSKLLADVIDITVKFKDGVKVEAAA